MQFLLSSALYLAFNKRITRHTKKQKTQFKETEQSSESDLDMAGILELLDQEFTATMINMLRALMEEVDNMQEQMDNVS